MESARRGDEFLCPSSPPAIARIQNRSTCTCFPRKRYEKSTQTDAVPAETETVNFKPVANSKQTCTRCYSHGEKIKYEIEPYAGSSTQFNETYNEPDSRDSAASTPSSSSGFNDSADAKLPFSRDSKNGENLTPKEIMNTWIPGRVRPAERLFTPGENYIDVSPRSFSTRKYFPEFFLSDHERSEMRAKEREELQETGKQQEECRDPKCPKGTCDSEDMNDLRLSRDWQIITEGSGIRIPSPWSDEDLALANEREEVTNGESNVKDVQVPPKSPSSWFGWCCRKSKEERIKEPDKGKHDKR